MSLSEGLPPREPLPQLNTHPNISPFRVHNGILGNGVLYESNLPSIPSPEVREALICFGVGETDIPGLSTTQRFQLLGQITHLNSISCAIATIKAHITSLDPASQGPIDNGQRGRGFTSSQTLLSIQKNAQPPACGGQLGPLGHQTPSYSTPMDPQLYPRNLDLQRRLLYQRQPPHRGCGGACPYMYHHIHRRRRNRQNPQHHAGITVSCHSHGL